VFPWVIYLVGSRYGDTDTWAAAYLLLPGFAVMGGDSPCAWSAVLMAGGDSPCAGHRDIFWGSQGVPP
jgi:hypothetical protein